MSIIRETLIFFETPRNRIITIIGLEVTRGIETLVKSDLERLRKQLSEREMQEARTALLHLMLKERLVR